MADILIYINFCSSSVVRDWCSTGADWYTQPVRNSTRTKALTTHSSYHTECSTEVTSHLPITVQLSLRDRKQSKTNTALIISLISKITFKKKKISIFGAVAGNNDQSCGHAPTSPDDSTFLTLFHKCKDSTALSV